MTPRQIPQSTQNNWKPNWSLIFTIAAFVLGYGINAFINYMGYANKVDLLTKEVSQLTQIVGQMNNKIDEGNVKYYDLDKRLSILETEQSQKIKK